VSDLAAAPKVCFLKLRRIGDAESQPVATQYWPGIPTIGDVIEVDVDGAILRARVFRVDAEIAEGKATVEADELSSGYACDALSVMLQFSAEESHANVASPASSQPHLAFDATLGLVRQSHALARRFLDRPKPDLATALRYMKAARRAAWLAFPYIKDEELKRRIVGYKPMSEEEWEHFWPSPPSRK
jgi:hypothetical protein